MDRVSGSPPEPRPDPPRDVETFRTTAMRRKQASHLSLTITADDAVPENTPAPRTGASLRPNERAGELLPTPPSGVSDDTTAASSASGERRVAGEGPEMGGTHAVDGGSALDASAARDPTRPAPWETAFELLNAALFAHALIRAGQTLVLNGVARNDIGRFFLVAAPVWTTYSCCLPAADLRLAPGKKPRLAAAVLLLGSAMRMFALPALALGFGQASPFALHPVERSSTTSPFCLMLVVARLLACVELGFVAVQRSEPSRAWEVGLLAMGCFAYGFAGVVDAGNPQLSGGLWWFAASWEVVRVLAGDLGRVLEARPRRSVISPTEAKPGSSVVPPKVALWLKTFGTSTLGEPSPADNPPAMGLPARRELLGFLFAALEIVAASTPAHQPTVDYSLYSYYLALLLLLSFLPIVSSLPILRSALPASWHLAAHLALSFTCSALLRLSQMPRAPVPGAVIAIERYLSQPPPGMPIESSRRYGLAAPPLAAQGTASLAATVPDLRCAILLGWAILWGLLAMLVLPGRVQGVKGWRRTAARYLRPACRFAVAATFAALAFTLPYQPSLPLWTWTEARDSFMPLSAGTVVLAAIVGGLGGGALEVLSSWAETRLGYL